ncbi:MAG: hypothetical protein HQL40_18760, partial [Alphaproteobacteria bacterium]|nr:hypothetical protein [Alphaproteobacteria bacterium]
MTDFDGPNFFAGPYRWIEDPELAPRLMRSANLLTIRMYLHTMERAYRWSDPWEGFGAYETAFRSGGLAALLDRLALLLAEGDRGDGVVPFRA